MEEPKVITLSDAMRVYNAASAKVQFLCRHDQGAARFKTGKENYALDVGAAVADFARAGGDLAVTALEELHEVVKQQRITEESRAATTRRWQNIAIVMGGIIGIVTAAATVVQAYAATRPTPSPLCIQQGAPPR